MGGRVPKDDDADTKLVAALKKFCEDSYLEDKRSYNVNSTTDEGREEFRRWEAAVNREILQVMKPYTIKEAKVAMDQVGNLNTSLKALDQVIRSLQEEGFPQPDENHCTVGQVWRDLRIFMSPAATLIRHLEARKWRGERLFPEKFPTDLKKLVTIVELHIYGTAMLYTKDVSRRKIFDHYARLKNKSMIVRAYSDADWSKEYHGHSIAGRAIEVGGCLIHWGANKLSTPTTSTCDSEFGALHMARSHMVQVTELLRELGYKVENPTFMTDNEGAKKACRSAKFPDLTRSKWTKELLLRNEVRMGLWKVEKIAAEDNLADAFTKPLLPN